MCMLTCNNKTTHTHTSVSVWRKMSFGMGKVTLFFFLYLTPSFPKTKNKKINKKWLSLLTLYILFQFNCLQWCSFTSAQEEKKKKNKNYTRKWRIVIWFFFLLLLFPWQIAAIKSFRSRIVAGIVVGAVSADKLKFLDLDNEKSWP